MPTDILFDNNGDLAIFAGDFTIGDSTAQEVEDIILSYPGWWKEFPSVGVGAPDYLKSPGDDQQLIGSILLQLKVDGKLMQDYSSSMDANGNLVINIDGIEVIINP